MDNLNILIVGKSSFLAQHFRDFCILKNINCKIISYYEISTINLSEFNVILNCAITNEYKSISYSHNFDIDKLLVDRIVDLPIKYIMISSSKVYGNSLSLKIYSEDSQVNPFDFHSENKIITENYIQSSLVDYLILRGSNFFGEEYGRTSFFGYCLTNLKHKNNIPLTIDGTIIRDFISINSVCELIFLSIINGLIGIFNLSSGIGLSVDNIVDNLIFGYGSGEKIIVGDTPDRQFILCNKNIKKSLNLDFVFDKNEIIEIGKKLKR